MSVVGPPDTSAVVVKGAVNSLKRAGITTLLADELARLSESGRIHGLVHLALLAMAASVPNERNLRLPLIRLLMEAVMVEGKVPAKYALGERAAEFEQDVDAIDGLFWPAIADLVAC